MKHTNNEKAITLIALIVTIVVLLILASVSIAMLTGEDGIIERAKNAKETTDNAKNEENERIATYEKEINNIGRAGEMQSSAKKDILFTGTIDTVNQTEQFNTLGYDFFLVTCWWSDNIFETFIVPSEDKNLPQNAARYSDSNTEWYTRLGYTITDTGIIMNSIYKDNVTGCITRVIGIKI